MAVGDLWHAQIVASEDGTNSPLLSLVSDATNLWTSYLIAHMVDSRAHHDNQRLWPFGLGYSGVIMVTLYGGGYGYSSSFFKSPFVPEDEVEVFIPAWDQDSLDAAILRAETNGLTVVCTLRISDNVKTCMV